MRTVPIIVTSLISTALAASWSPAARAQDALGSGNALDANLSTGGKSNVGGPRVDYRARNAVITNNVAGGRGFRGSVGYTADNDFRGSLGSNDLYNFRAESALSSPDLFNLGSTYQQLRFGQGMGVVEYDRSGAGASGVNIAPSAITQDTRNPIASRRIGANDDFNTSQLQQLQQLQQLDRSSLVSSSAFTLQNAAEPRIVGLSYGKDNTPVLFTASNLRGLSAELAGQDLGLLGLTSLDEAKIRNDMDHGRKPEMIGAPFQTRFEPVRTGVGAEDTRIKPTGSGMEAPTEAEAGKNDPNSTGSAKGSGYDSIVQSMKDRYQKLGPGQMHSGDQPSASRLEQDYQDLRKQLSQGAIRSVNTQAEMVKPDGSKPDPSKPDSLKPDPSKSGQPAVKPRPLDDPTKSADPMQSPAGIRTTPRPGEMTDEPLRDPNVDGTADPKDPMSPPDASKSAPLTLEQYGVILRHGQKVETLSSANQDRFDELMSTAEEKLRQGEYFWAERRFERALRFTPGHPLATAGSAHAQLGAGLYLSSALTLHNLFVSQPEMIDVRYAESLLPKPERINEAVRAVRIKIDEEQSAESADDRASCAFVLAYLGHQTGDAAMVSQGLEAMAKYGPDDKLLPLLKTVWQDGEAGK